MRGAGLAALIAALPSQRSWIFQATPQSLDLLSELRTGEALTWSVARYARAVQPGDRVYYWQAGRDAGIYGVGRIESVTAGAMGTPAAVRTVHDRPLFAPITRAELRADPVLSGLSVLRQARGTVFPLSPEQDDALRARLGEATAALAVPAQRVRGHSVRIRRARDEAAYAEIAAAERRSTVPAIVVVRDGQIVARRLVAAVHHLPSGDLRLDLAPDSLPAGIDLPDETRASLTGGHIGLLPIPDAGEPLPRAVAEEESAYEPLPSLSAELVKGDLELPDAVIQQLLTCVAAGQHILLLGLPGTGKTTLARNLAEAAHRAGLCGEPLVATATADWTTFDTIGGLVPRPDGTLDFSEGVALRALRENRWLVLDELNRADVDKAFGALLTVLAGTAVELPALMKGGRPIRVQPVAGSSGISPDGATYYLGSRWHIIATMNTRDRAALFSFSLALARRFAFVVVPALEPPALAGFLRRAVPLQGRAAALVERLVAVLPSPLGPAVLLDAARHLAARAGGGGLVEAVGSFVLPQLEGVSPARLHAFVGDLSGVLDADEQAALHAYVDLLHGSV